ncbi:type I methionyl aminopeptidase [Exiguobacterium mexicanum]|uniref:Methionine aminopeptidase n=1 Tax=Exiguobacterium mexicanum TaxID=340146 RepID=A0ABT7MQM0_9BACL|nr:MULTISPECIES: type I methionyl aminopeptidase [Exiguobacterium]MDL5377477.1 type I methionyl aminopeptidase [Exiguobacterium mexicanum]
MLDYDYDALREIGRIVALARDEMAKAVEPGMTTKQLDEIGQRILEAEGAASAPITMYEFPGYTCISINEVAAHGIPGELVIQDGDVVNVDVSAVKDGYYADTGRTVIAGTPKSAKHERLVEVSLTSLEAGLSKVKAGVKVNQIGKAIYADARKNGFTVIRNLAGHGLGRTLHGEPETISNYYSREENDILKEGQVIAVETFISTQDEIVYQSEEDGWSLFTPNNSLVSQFEHTVVVTKDGYEVLTGTFR